MKLGFQNLHGAVFELPPQTQTVMKTTVKISILLAALFTQAAYSQRQPDRSQSITSEQLKITHISNRQNFLENRIASLDYDVSRTTDLWVSLYTLPQEGALHDTVRITVGGRTVAVPAQVETEQRSLSIETNRDASSLDYTSAQSTNSSSSTSSSAIQVNPDGTQSTIHYQGNTKLVVSPNGSHTVMPNNETSTVVNTDSTQQRMSKMNTSTTLVANPDGSHSTIYHSAPLVTTGSPESGNVKEAVPVHYSRLHIHATPALLKQLQQTKKLTLEVQLSSQTIELEMYTRPLQRYQQKLAATRAATKK
jgi:hypothetical protein